MNALAKFKMPLSRIKAAFKYLLYYCAVVVWEEVVVPEVLPEAVLPVLLDALLEDELGFVLEEL